MANLNELMNRLRLTIAVPQAEDNGEASTEEAGDEKILRLDINEYNYILESLQARVQQIKSKRQRAVASDDEMLRKTYGYKQFHICELIRKMRAAKVQ